MPEETQKIEIDAATALQIAQHIYHKWEQEMQPPILLYLDFHDWLEMRLAQCSEPVYKLVSTEVEEPKPDAKAPRSRKGGKPK